MSSEGRGLTKWQVAALGAGAVAVVAGGAIVAYACVKRRGKSKRDDHPEATPQTQSERSSSGSQSGTAAASHPASEQQVRTPESRDSFAIVCGCVVGVQYLE